jgi:hypothetical protein
VQPSISTRVGIPHALAEAMDEGHGGLLTEELQALTAELLEIPAAFGRARVSRRTSPAGRRRGSLQELVEDRRLRADR